MELMQEQNNGAVVRLTKTELTTLNNALNEILHGPEAIEAWEFHTRVGVEVSEAESLLSDFAHVLKSGGGIA